MSEQLWTSFNDKKFAAERAKYDWNGRELSTITSANNGTLSITVGSGNAQTFTANQATNTTTTVTIPVASVTSGTGSEGLMSAAMAEKLAGVATGATHVGVGTNNGDIAVTDASGNTTQMNVYTHATDGANKSAGETANKTPSFGGKFKVVRAIVDQLGHTTELTDYEITIPNATATASTGGSGGTDGLMSAADKEKLNGLTVNDATLTITVAGTAHTFTANSSTATSVSIPNATSASGQNPATGGLMTATDKANLDFANSVIPQSGSYPASTSNMLVTHNELVAAQGLTTAFEVVNLTSGANPVPDVANPQTNVIYLTKDTSSSATDPYTEWIYVEDSTTTPSTYTWEVIGETSVDLSKYKPKQTAVSDPTVPSTGTTTSLTFIDSISQDANGVISPTKKTVATMVGAQSNTAGQAGLVPAPASTDEDKFLKGDGTWATVSTVDEKVKATAKTDNVNYEILATASASPNSGEATEAVYDTEITLNPSTNTIAANISGDAATASAAKTGSALETAIGGKADKVTGATNGNLAAFDSNGNLVDSTAKPSDFKTVQTAVSDPTASGNATSFIDSISQNTNGDITVSKKTVSTVTASTSGSGGNNGLMTAAQAETLAALNHWKYDTFGDSSGPSGTETAVSY